MGAPNQQAAWPQGADLDEQAVAARDEARRTFPLRARGFSRTHGASDVLLQAAVAALRAGRPGDFVVALDGVRRQLDALEELWIVATGKPEQVAS